MKKFTQPRLKYLLLSLVIAAVLLVCVEGIRYFLAKTELERVAQLILRYVSTGQYPIDVLTYCQLPNVLDRTVQVLRDDYGMTTISYKLNSKPTTNDIDGQLLMKLNKMDNTVPCRIDHRIFEKPEWESLPVYDAWMGSARLAFVHKLARESISPWSLDASRVRVHFCSDRPGYHYDDKTNQCLPREDLGRSYDGGDKVRIEMSYDYWVGSSLGLNLVLIPLQSIYINSVECFRVGCSSIIDFVFTRPIKGNYWLEVFTPRDGRRVIHCLEGKEIGFSETNTFGHCYENEVNMNISDPLDYFNYTLHFEGQIVKNEVLNPLYGVSYVNGPRCHPTCWGSLVKIQLP